jgi:predicted DNA-binding protein
MTVASNYALRLPASLKRELENWAKDDGKSPNQFIVTAAAEKLATLRTTEFFAERVARGDVAAALAILDRAGGAAPRDGDELPHKA